MIRDYAEDQSLGLVNVPREVWLGNQTQAWFERRHAQVLFDLEQAKAELKSLEGEVGYGLLRLFFRSVERYAQNPTKARPKVA